MMQPTFSGHDAIVREKKEAFQDLVFKVGDPKKRQTHLQLELPKTQEPTRPSLRLTSQQHINVVEGVPNCNDVEIQSLQFLAKLSISWEKL